MLRLRSWVLWSRDDVREGCPLAQQTGAVSRSSNGKRLAQSQRLHLYSRYRTWLASFEFAGMGNWSRKRESVAMRKMCQVGLTGAIFWMSTGCELFDPDRKAQTSEAVEVRLIVDSERVQRLISHQDAVQQNERAGVVLFLKDEGRLLEQGSPRELDDLLKHPEKYIPSRIAFLDAMDREPAIVVQRKSFCRILKRSNAICARGPVENPDFVKVRVTSGPDRGIEGWGCLGDGIGMTVAWP